MRKSKIVLHRYRPFHWIHKTNDIYKEIGVNIEIRFHTSNYQLYRPLPKGKNKKSNWISENELGGKVMIKFVGLRVKTSSYLIDDSSENKKVKGTKKWIIKRKLKFKIIKTL